MCCRSEHSQSFSTAHQGGKCGPNWSSPGDRGGGSSETTPSTTHPPRLSPLACIAAVNCGTLCVSWNCTHTPTSGRRRFTLLKLPSVPKLTLLFYLQQIGSIKWRNACESSSLLSLRYHHYHLGGKEIVYLIPDKDEKKMNNSRALTLPTNYVCPITRYL